MEQPTASAQFATDYTTVIDNNSEAYSLALDIARESGGNVATASDVFRAQFENAIAQVIEREEEQGNTLIADLIRELLLGFGSTPFDLIAKHYIDTDLEQRLYENFSRSLSKAGQN